MRSLLFLLLITGNLSAQVSVNGKVVEKHTGLPVAFASIGLLHENTGASADKNGEFNLTARSIKDTLIISSIGFETIKLPLDAAMPLVVHLEKKYFTLKEVVVKDRWKTVRLGNTRGCGTGSLISSGYQVEMAQRFSIDKPDAFLKQVQLCFSVPFFSGRSYRFRLRVYDADISGKPGEDLTGEVIEVKSDDRQAIVDLSDYHIRIPGNHFYISVQWLFIPENERPSMYDGRKIYGPPLGVEEGDSTGHTTWLLSHNRQWFSSTKFNKVAMSVALKY